MREIINAIFCVMRSGCAWRLVPSDPPPWETIYRWFAAWRDDGCFERINHAFVIGRVANATAIAVQIVRTVPEQVGFAARGAATRPR